MALAISERIEDVYEVCPSCKGTMKAGQYLCKKCYRQPKAPMVLVADQPEFAPKRYNRDSRYDDICMYCVMLEPCKERVKLGSWCYCEIPDSLDYLSMIQDGTAIKILERRSPVTGRFEKGNTPWNVGMSSFDPSPGTHFKVGSAPQNKMTIGAEVETKGYVRRKVAEPNIWRQRSHIIWEDHHERSLPGGWIVRHKDGNPLNDDPHNLEAMSRSRNLNETLKDPVVLKRKKEGTAIANQKRWKEYHRAKTIC